MDTIGRSELRQLVEVAQEPCISVYFGTHRAGADTLQDPIRLKNLIREAENRLEARGEQLSSIRELLDPLRELVDQYEFWQHQAEGLALFRSRDFFRHYRLPFDVPELVAVGARFHLKPLLATLEANQRFYVLALSQEDVKVYEANQRGLTEMEIPEMPRSPLCSTGEQDTEHRLQSHTGERQIHGRHFAVFHGQGAEEEDRKKMLLSYFRHVDASLRKSLNGRTGPLVLAAVDYLCPIYRQASLSPDLLSQEIHGNPNSFTTEELHRLAWSIASAHFRSLRCTAADEYHQLWHTQRASKDLPAILAAAQQGRIQSLFVAVGIQQWGHVDPLNAEVVQREPCSAQDEDLLNVAAIETFIAGGVVYAVPPEEVPGRGTVAAVFRY